MRILVVGETSKSNSACTAFAKAFRVLGHSVSTFDPTQECASDPTLLRRIYESLYRTPPEKLRRRMVSRLLDVVWGGGFDLIFVMKGPSLSAANVRDIRRAGAPVVVLNQDDYFNTEGRNLSPFMLDALPFYDRVIVTKKINQSELALRGIRAEFTQFAYDPDFFHPVEGRPGVPYADIVFVGTYASERPALLEPLAQRYGSKFKIFGNGWDRFPASSPLGACVTGKAIQGDDQCSLFGHAKVSIGLLRKANRDDHTTRTFEIPACRGVLVAERTQRHQDLFDEGTEALFFDVDRPSELIAAIDLALENPDLVESLRQRGHQRVVSGHHTYVDRAAEILQMLSDL